MKRKSIILSAVIAVFVMVFLVSSVSALNEYSCVVAEISDISPSSIKIGDEFTIGIHIENCGDRIPQNVSFEILSLPPHISVKESLITEIPKIQYANSERFLIFHMKIDNEAESGVYVIKTRLSYGDRTSKIIKDDEISIDVIGDEAELSIASLKTSPVLPRKGETVELIMRIENTGDGTAKSVEVYMDHPFQGLKQSFIGALDPNEDGPAILTFIVDESGEFEFPVTISYKDDFGANEIKTNVNLNVLKKESNIWLIIFVILILAVFGWGIYYFIKTKKSKEKIIHQLLQGENFKPERLEDTTKKHIKKSHEEKEEREKKEKRKREFKREILEKYKK